MHLPTQTKPGQHHIYTSVPYSPAILTTNPLRPPNPLDRLRQANVIRLELVQPHTDKRRRGAESPVESALRLGVLARGDVVGDDVLEAHVRVEEERAAEDGVEARVEGAGGKRSESEGHEAQGEGAVESPVVGAVGGIALLLDDGIIDWE